MLPYLHINEDLSSGNFKSPSLIRRPPSTHAASRTLFSWTPEETCPLVRPLGATFWDCFCDSGQPLYTYLGSMIQALHLAEANVGIYSISSLFTVDQSKSTVTPHHFTHPISSDPWTPPVQAKSRMQVIKNHHHTLHSTNTRSPLRRLKFPKGVRQQKVC